VAYLGPLDRVVPRKRVVAQKRLPHTPTHYMLAGCPPSSTRGTILLGHVSTILFMASGSSYTCGDMGIRTNGHLSFVHGLRKKFHKEMKGKEIYYYYYYYYYNFILFKIKYFG